MDQRRPSLNNPARFRRGTGRCRRERNATFVGAPAPLRGGWLVAVLVVPVAFLGVFFVYPVVSVLDRGLSGSGSTFGDVLAKGSTWRTVWFTTWQAAISTVLTLIVGLPAAWALARHDFRGRSAVRAAVVIPFVMPTLVVGAALRSLFARFGLDNGAINLDQSVWAILIAHVIFNVAVVIRVVGGYWALLDHRSIDAARVLGANRRQVWREVTYPHLRSSLWSAATIVFLFCFTSFGVILVVGGPRRVTLETEIWRYATQRTDFATAAVLAIVQLVFVLALVLLSTRAERRAQTRSSLQTVRRRPLVDTQRRVTVAAILGSTLVFLLMPFAVMVERSLSVGDGYGWANFRALTDTSDNQALLVAPIEAVRNSLVSATQATLIALTVGALAAAAVVYGPRLVGRSLDVGLMVPLGTSAVTVGFGMLVALDTPPLDLRTSPYIVPIAQAVIGVPFVLRAVVPVLRAIDDRLRQAASVLGAAPLRVRREIDLPIARRALLAATGFAFAISLGEFGATAFLARPNQPTVPVAMFRLLGQPGATRRGQAMALGVILSLLTLASVVVIERFQREERSGW